MPVYKRDRHLPEAIDSVLAQTLIEWELLVIDDGFTDTTASMLTRYEGLIHPLQLRYIRQRDQRLAVAYNHGMQLARGDAIAFLRPGDWFVPTKLERQWAMLQAHPQIGMVNSGWQHVNADGETIIKVMPWHDCPQLDLDHWLQWRPIRLSALMVRREWLLRADGFNSRLPGAAVTDWVLQLAAMGCRAEWVRQTTVHCRTDVGEMEDALERGRSLATVIDQFLARSDLPIDVKRRKCQIRFTVRTWIAWDLYRAGHLAVMVDYLKQSWCDSPYPPVDTMIMWVESFADWSRRWGQPLETELLCGASEWQGLMRWCMQVSSNPNRGIETSLPG